MQQGGRLPEPRPDPGTDLEADAEWLGPRPLLVGVASVLLVVVGVVELLLATLVFTVYGAASLVLAAPTAALGAGSVVLGARVRGGRNRTAALVVASVTMLLAPLALGITLLGLGVSVSTMTVIVALVRHREWFRAAASA